MRVTGASDSGKTTLIERLIPRLRAKGIRVGTVKHAHHGFELVSPRAGARIASCPQCGRSLEADPAGGGVDRPGKDSWRHLRAGSDATALVSPERAAWIMRTPVEYSVDEAASPMAGRVDLILAEGFKGNNGHPSIRLEPGPRKRLEVGAGVCRVGVHPGALLPRELDRVAAFCASVIREAEPCRES